MSDFPTEVIEAQKLANKARLNAYAHYSKVKVGAAIKVKGNDKIYAGCNVENAVNAASVCAERTALYSAVADQGKPELEYVVVCTNTEPVLYPCGVCLQSMVEFCSGDMPIYISNPNEVLKKILLKELLTVQYDQLPKVLDD